MATFSQQFLANLGNAGGMLQGASNLGAAIGGIPGQIKEKRVKQEDAEALAGVKQGSPGYFNILAQQSMRDGDRIKAAEFTAKAADAERRETLIGREDEDYRREGQERDAAKQIQISQTMSQLGRLQSFMSNKTATPQQKMDAQRLMKSIRSAGDSGGAAFAGQVDLLLEGKSYDPERYIGLGNNVFDQQTGLFIRPDGSAKDSLSQKDITALQEKYIKDGFSPENVFKAVTNEGVIDLTLLGKKQEDSNVGSVSTYAEKEMIRISGEATKSAFDLSRNEENIAALMVDDNYIGGLPGQIRTTILGVAGLRDATEIEKTAFIKQRNDSLVQGLPPGVASDKDIELVKSGLPPDNASRAEVIAYLQAESRLLRAKGDIALLSENHIRTQQQKGEEARMIGIESKKIAYGSVVRQSRRALAAAGVPGDPLYNEEVEKQKRYLLESIGFVPSYLRNL